MKNYGKYEIEIKYDGKWPCLCSGRLIVTIDGKEWDFGKYVLVSGGSVWYGECEDIVKQGDWDIEDESFPDGFFKEYSSDMKTLVIEAVNDNVPKGCCGGCL